MELVEPNCTAPEITLWHFAELRNGFFLNLETRVSFPLHPCVPESPTLSLFLFFIFLPSPGTSNRQETEFQPMASREQSPSICGAMANLLRVSVSLTKAATSAVGRQMPSR